MPVITGPPDPPEGVDPEMWELGKSVFFVEPAIRVGYECWMCGTIKVMTCGIYVCPWCDCFHEGDNHRTCKCHFPKRVS